MAGGAGLRQRMLHPWRHLGQRRWQHAFDISNYMLFGTGVLGTRLTVLTSTAILAVRVSNNGNWTMTGVLRKQPQFQSDWVLPSPA